MSGKRLLKQSRFCKLHPNFINHLSAKHSHLTPDTFYKGNVIFNWGSCCIFCAARIHFCHKWIELPCRIYDITYFANVWRWYGVKINRSSFIYQRHLATNGHDQDSCTIQANLIWNMSTVANPDFTMSGGQQFEKEWIQDKVDIKWCRWKSEHITQCP